MRLAVAVDKELAQLNQREVDTEVAGDDDNEIGEGADGEMNENAVVRYYLRVTATPRFARAFSYAKKVVLTNAGSPILRIAMLPKQEKHNNVKARLYCMRVDVAVIIHITQALWSDQRLTHIM